MTNPTDPAAVAREVLAKTWHDEGREELAKSIAKGTDSEWTKSGPAVRAMVSYGDQREKAAVERVVAWMREPSDTLRAPIVQHTIDVLSDMIERGDHLAHKEASDGTA